MFYEKRERGWLGFCKSQYTCGGQRPLTQLFLPPCGSPRDEPRPRGWMVSASVLGTYCWPRYLYFTDNKYEQEKPGNCLKDTS